MGALMQNILIVPGLFGSSEAHWQRHWLADVPGSTLVEQPDWHKPDLDAWTARLEEALEAAPAFIVAHSLGCHLIAALAGRPSAKNVRGALLVAPCDLRITRFLHPDNLSAFAPARSGPLPFAVTVVGSLNDIYMPLENLSALAEDWRAEVHLLGQAGHINVESGYGRWTRGYAIFNSLRERVLYQEKQENRRGSRRDSLAMDHPDLHPAVGVSP
jgi:predicted alpha/beta hydrolase family esterase